MKMGKDKRDALLAERDVKIRAAVAAYEENIKAFHEQLDTKIHALRMDYVQRTLKQIDEEVQ